MAKQNPYHHVTIRDVASAAHVSPATVSLVLNNRPNVSEEIRNVVLSTADRLRYIPRASGRPLNVQREFGNPAPLRLKFAFVYECLTMEDVTYSTMIDSIAETLKHNRIDLVMQQIDSAVLSHDIAGVLCLAHDWSEEGKALIGSLPTVICMGLPQSHGDHVSYDNSIIGDLAANYIQSRGFPRAAILRCKGGIFTERCDRLAEVLKRNGIPSFETTPMEHAELYENAENMKFVLQELCAATEMPEVLFSPADQLTSVLYPVLASMGYRPGVYPEIISCNCERRVLRSLYQAPPHEIDLQCRTIGRLAAQQLLWRLNHPDAPLQQIRVTPLLITSDKVMNYVIN